MSLNIKLLVTVIAWVCNVSWLQAQTIEQVYAQVLQGSGSEFGQAIDYDPAGNLYWAGGFSSNTASLIGSTLPDLNSASTNNLFLIKYGADKQPAWAIALEGSGNNTLYDLAVDADGNAYIIGSIYGTIDFDPTAGTNQKTSIGSFDIFMAKYNSQGALVWATLIGTNEAEVGYGIAVAQHTSQLYITGYFRYTVDFDPSAATGTATGYSNRYAAFLAAYDLDGNFNWVVDIHNSDANSNHYGRALATDNSGNAYLTGYTQGSSVVFGSTNGQTQTKQDGTDNSAAFIAKYTNEGVITWQASVSDNTDACIGQGVNVGPDGSAYLTGYFRGGADFDPSSGVDYKTSTASNDGFLSKYTPNGGYEWTHQFTGNSSVYCQKVAIDNENRIVVAGYFSGTLDLNLGEEVPLNGSTIGHDAFFSTLYPNGREIQGYIVGDSSANGFSYDRYLDAELNPVTGEFAFSGYFEDVVDLDPSPDKETLVSSLGRDAVLAAYTIDLPPPTYYVVQHEPLMECQEGTLCLPFTTNQPLPKGIIGLDVSISYDPAYLRPTGRLFLKEVAVRGAKDNAQAKASTYIDVQENEVRFSIYYEGEGELLTQGTIACLEMEVIAPIPDATTAIDGLTVKESYLLGTKTEALGKREQVYSRNEFGQLIFWNDGTKPLRYDPNRPGDYLETILAATDALGTAVDWPEQTPDPFGHFTAWFRNSYMTISRDIPGTYGTSLCPVDVTPFINGQDVYAMRLVTTGNRGFTPNPYQLLAMDVNLDGEVSAGDMTLLYHRVLGLDCEFPQAWNYDTTSLPTAPSIDWLFVDDYTVQNDNSWIPSASYPDDDGAGFSKTRLPLVPYPLPKAQPVDGCNPNIYHGILLGDVSGNWVGNNGHQTPVTLRTQATAAARLNLEGLLETLPNGTAATQGHRWLPLTVVGVDRLTALDLTIGEQHTGAQPQRAAWGSQVANDLQLRSRDEPFQLTSWATVLDGVPAANAVLYLEVPASTTGADWQDLFVYINGERAQVQGLGEVTALPEDLLKGVTLFPNPTQGTVTINVQDLPAQEGHLHLIDLTGRTVWADGLAFSNGQAVANLASVPVGLYVARLSTPHGQWQQLLVVE